MTVLQRLYPILDAGCFSNTRELIAAAEELVAAGVTLIQYRNKSGNARSNAGAGAGTARAFS